MRENDLLDSLTASEASLEWSKIETRVYVITNVLSQVPSKGRHPRGIPCTLESASTNRFDVSSSISRNFSSSEKASLTATFGSGT